MNVGNERTATIKELAETIVKVSGKKIEIKYDKSKLVGPLSRIPSVERIKRKLKWKTHTSLEDGIRFTYKWIESNHLIDRHLERTC